jgi:hypothetical protein
VRATGAADSPSPPSFRHWLAVGAQPSKPVAWLLDRAGVAPAPPRAAPAKTTARGVKHPDKPGRKAGGGAGA